MGTKGKTGNRAWRVLLVAGILAAPATALAHIRWIAPVPRSQADGLKPPTYPAPCGNVARTNKPTSYSVGQTITVKWSETVPHEGCYQVAFSPDDVNWVTLTQVVDPVNLQAMNMTNVTLPAGVSCMNCTLQLRQIMLDNVANKTCAPDAAPPSGGANGNTYYSCADICVGAGCPEAGAPDPDGGSSSGDPATTDDGGPTTVPTDGGGKFVDGGDDDDDKPGAAPRNLRTGEGGGCNIALGATSGLSFAVTAGLLGLALARRRRKR